MNKEDVMKLAKTRGFMLSNGELFCLRYIDPEDVNKLQDWIPVTERLPEEDARVLVTTETEYGLSVEYAYMGKYGFNTRNVTGWMPLPEPWKGGQDEVN